MEPKLHLLYRVKGVCYATEIEARVMAAGKGEWGGDETIDKVTMLEWQGKHYTETWGLCIEAAAPELVRLYEQVGHEEFKKIASQMRRS